MADDNNGRRFSRPTDVRDLFMAAGINVSDPEDRERFAEVWRWVEQRYDSRGERHKVMRVIGSGATVAVFSAILTQIAAWVVQWLHR